MQLSLGACAMYFKVVDKNLQHSGFTLKLDTKNDLGEPFNPEEKYVSRGLYFSDLKHITRFSDYGQYVIEIEVPDTDSKGDPVLMEKYPYWAEWRASCIIPKSPVYTWEEFVEKYNVLENIDEASLLGCLNWIKKNTHKQCTTDAMDCAAQMGHLDVVRYLHENRTEGCTIQAMDLAAENGHLDVVKWLHENRSEGCTTWAIDHAAQRGNLDVIKWLHENRTEGFTNHAINGATDFGHLDVVEYLRKNQVRVC